jgi:glycerophosphoryl diester phosphodiesterase
MKNMNDQTGSPWIVAHRGAMDEAPENTRSAFNAALAHEIDGIELDVQMTRDSALVLYHDHDLQKIGGGREPVGERDYKDLCRLDWGGWHSEAFRGEGPVSLDQVVDLYAQKTRLLIEIKSFEEDQRTGRSLELTARVVDLLDDRVSKTHEDNIFILSFDPGVLSYARRRSTRPWQLVLNTNTPRDPLSDLELASHLFAYSASIARLDHSVTKRWRESGKTIMTYTCNTPAAVDRAYDLGCDVIMTDRPGWIVEYLASGNSDR